MDRLSSIMKEVREGSEDALYELMIQWRHLLDSLAYSILNDRATADDIVQEAFAVIWRRRRQYDPERPAWPWIAKIVRNLCHQQWRKRGGRRKEGARLELPIEYAGYVRCPDPTPDVHNEQAELVELVRKRIAQLPAVFREVLQLSFFLEKTDEEIAQLLGIPIGTVKSRKHRGLNEIRGKIKKDLDREGYG